MDLGLSSVMDLTAAIAALRAEMNTALSALEPGARGLQELASIGLSSSAKIAVGTQIDMRARRRNLILALLAALDSFATAKAALIADGYPNMPKAQIFQAVFDEIQAHSGDIATAVALFEAEDHSAAKMSISLGSPADK